MKKILSFLALALAFTACQTEPVETVTNDGLVDVVLTVDAPELGVTRADGDANAAKNSAFGAIDFLTDADWANYDLRYILEVYDANEDGTGTPIYRERMVNCLDKYAPTTFALRLVPNREYKFVVFADFVAEGNAELTEPAAKLAIADLYYNTADLRNVTAITTEQTWGAMNEIRDAYFVTENVQITTGLNKTLTLTRPFAKLRVIATDLDYIAGYSAPGYVEVTYKNEPIYKSFNAVNGKLNAEQMAGDELSYGYEVSKTIPYTAGYDEFSTNQTLFTDYLLAVEGEQTAVNFEMVVYESKGGREIHRQDFSTQIPIQRNHLTTIVGDLLTTQANITIEIDDNFVDEFVRGWGDDNATKINVWNAGELNADGDYTFVVEGENDFEVTINAAAVENQKLAAGTYVLAEDAEDGEKLTFTVESLQANETTRALVDVEVIGGTMDVVVNGEEYAITLDLVLQFVENKDVRHAIYTYEGPIAFGKVLDTPKVEAAVEGNVITLTWNAVADATSYTVSGVADMPVVTEETSYVFTGEYETEYTFTVVAVNDNLASQPYTVVATTDAAPVVETYKLYFNNLANWSKVYAHIWANEGEDLGLESVEWPGRELTETEELDGVTYYVFQLPAEATGKTVNVVFNDGAGTQTKDLAGVVEGNLFFDNYVEPVAPSDVVLYLQPNANWNVDDARFAAYFFGNGETWVDMTLVEGETNIYAVTVPAGFESVIFCRMNPGAAANNWNNKWNQTEDLTVPTDGTNLYTVNEDTWDNGGGVWSVYAPAVEPEEPTALATPVVTAVAKENTVTLTWEAVENAAQYGITVGTEMPVFVEETTYTFTGEYETEYTFNVVAVPADEETYAVSEAAVVTATTEAAPVVEPEVLAELDTDAHYIFKQATEMKGGKWYAIVYENKAATGLTGNYGYLKITDAIARGEGISLPANCAFGFLTTEGGYTIQQFDNKYVYQTGSYDSFNVNATLPTDGGVWSVAVNGNEYTITNNTMSKFVQYDPSYNSYGCYAASKGNLPTLYELVEVDTTPSILDVSTSKMSFAHEGGSNNVTVTTYGNATLNASVDAAWVSTSIAENVVTVNVEANAGDAREATLTITYGDDSRTIAISQAKFQEAGEVTTYTDTLVSSMFKATSTTYTEFSGVAGTNGAVYAGKSAKSSNGGYIQLRSSKSEDGIVTTASGGKVKKIVVEWDETNTTAGRTLDVYVSNTAYTSATELYGTVVGEKIGNIVKGTSTELVIEGDYDYVGLRSNSGAMYIKSITITYEK